MIVDLQLPFFIARYLVSEHNGTTREFMDARAVSIYSETRWRILSGQVTRPGKLYFVLRFST